MNFQSMNPNQGIDFLLCSTHLPSRNSKAATPSANPMLLAWKVCTKSDVKDEAPNREFNETMWKVCELEPTATNLESKLHATCLHCGYKSFSIKLIQVQSFSIFHFQSSCSRRIILKKIRFNDFFDQMNKKNKLDQTS